MMRDPVVAADGHTYERAGAERWFAGHGAVSMVTGAPLPHAHLVPNQASLAPLPAATAAASVDRRVHCSVHLAVAAYVCV